MKNIKYKIQDLPIQIASEPEILYTSGKKLDEYSITKFNALNKKLLFNQAEWATILHISDRTLQRYLKEHKPFEGLYAEHLYQLENMADLALKVFDHTNAVKLWLQEPKDVLGKILDFSALQSFWGVKLISNELGRILYGVYI